VRQVFGLLRDYRNPDLIEHTVEELVAQRVYGLPLVYEDLNDYEECEGPLCLGGVVEKCRPASERCCRKAR